MHINHSFQRLAAGVSVSVPARTPDPGQADVALVAAPGALALSGNPGLCRS